MVTEEAYAAVVAENARQAERIAQLEAELAQALQRIADLEAKKTPPPSFVKANVPARAPKPRRPRAPEHNHARRREVPTQIVAHPITHCPACGGALGGVHVGRTRQVIDLPPPPPVEVIEHQVQRGWCSACHAWREAPLDLSGQVRGRGRLGVRVAAVVAHLRLVLRLPIRQIRTSLAELHGLRVSVGEVVDLLRRVAVAGQGAYQQLRAQVRASPVVHADETGWRESGRNGYIWSATTPTGARYFEYHHSRAGAVINALLGEDFRGVVVSDFYAAYNDTPGGRHQRCWVHLLRDLHALKQEHADRFEVVVWATALHDLYRLATAGPGAPAWPPPTEAEMVAAVVGLGEQFAQQPTHPCHALAQRLLRHQDELFTFLRVAEVPPDNNAAERALRPLVVARKISGGTRSPQGSATRMTLASLFHTWLAHGLNPLQACYRLLQGPLPQV